MLKAGQGGSGGDLGLFMVEVYGKGEVKVDGESLGEFSSRRVKGSGLEVGSLKEYGADGVELLGDVGKLFAILRAFPPEEPTKKRLVGEMIGWSSRFGEYENGEPELHHVAGTLYAEGRIALGIIMLLANYLDSEPYEAERHLALGTRDSPEQLARVEYEWYTQDDSHTAALYAARTVFPYLLTGNLRSANKAYLIFTSRLSALNKHLSVQEVSGKTSDVRIYPSLPLLNFLGLLLLAVQRGSADLYKQLAKHYAPYINEVKIWDDALAQVGETYFGIKIPRAGNPLFDMMGSMLFGGGGSPKPATPKPKKVEGPAPPVVDLD